jgi:thymidylate synthase ThyX
MIEARVLAHSVAPCGSDILTFVCTYPRFIHAEVMTHRVFSRNAASSRAIPVAKMLERLLAEPAMPFYWGKNQKGMQAGQELDTDDILMASEQWLGARDHAIWRAQKLVELGVHKQIANRILEPWAHMVTIITATEWENFFSLRADPDAQPEFQELAYHMLQAYLESEPRQLAEGQWHVPFGDRYVDDVNDVALRLKIATARCARVSYMNFEGDFEYAKDYKLHDDLLKSGHMSPFEHCARAEAEPVRSGNFVGYTQYRKLFPNECRRLSREEMFCRLEAWRSKRAA